MFNVRIYICSNGKMKKKIMKIIGENLLFFTGASQIGKFYVYIGNKPDRAIENKLLENLRQEYMKYTHTN